jgi:hypothetical protein
MNHDYPQHHPDAEPDTRAAHWWELEHRATALRELIEMLQRSLDEHGEPAAVMVRADVPGDYDTSRWQRGHKYGVEGRINLNIWRGDDTGQVGNGNDILYVIADWMDWSPWLDENGRAIG